LLTPSFLLIVEPGISGVSDSVTETSVTSMTGAAASIVDRFKHVIITGGENIHPREVEQVLQKRQLPKKVSEREHRGK
jgi:acyl-CoA synthetase (AMP-forming)/AMP-acid ligase II